MFSFPSQQVKKVKKGDFLISEPLLPDKNFSRTVILIADDTDGRHIGFVINKIHQDFKLDDLILEYSGKERDI